MKIIRSCEECPAEKYNPPSSWDWYCKPFNIKLGTKPFIGIHPNCPLQDATQPTANAADVERRCPICNGFGKVASMPKRQMGYTIAPTEPKDVLEERLIPCPKCGRKLRR